MIQKCARSVCRAHTTYSEWNIPLGVSMVATLPIATIQFPAADIHGASLMIWSIGLAALAFGAPISYALMGAMVGQRLENPRLIKGLSLAMAALLVWVAITIGYEHVWLPLA